MQSVDLFMYPRDSRRCHKINIFSFLVGRRWRTITQFIKPSRDSPDDHKDSRESWSRHWSRSPHRNFNRSSRLRAFQLISQRFPRSRPSPMAFPRCERWKMDTGRRDVSLRRHFTTSFERNGHAWPARSSPPSPRFTSSTATRIRRNRTISVVFQPCRLGIPLFARLGIRCSTHERRSFRSKEVLLPVTLFNRSPNRLRYSRFAVAKIR